MFFGTPLMGTGCNNGAAAIASFRTYIKDPIGRFYDIQVVFNDGLPEWASVSMSLLKLVSRSCGVFKMEAGCGFIEKSTVIF